MSGTIVTVKISDHDALILRKIVKARGEDISSFVRGAIREKFASLGFLSSEEKQALGLGD